MTGREEENRRTNVSESLRFDFQIDDTYEQKINFSIILNAQLENSQYKERWNL